MPDTEGNMLLAIRNIRLFIAFSLFFNTRFYYPVFTILFLDYGLTVEQFSLLNTVWAVTIVLAEVPSGALADLIGRKRLLVTTAILMTIEMALIAFVPLGNGRLIFTVFLLNRVFSGLAEALASGADEALAYDALLDLGLADKWPQVLSIKMRSSSLAFILTSIIGALIYDPHALNRLLKLFGSSLELTQQTTMRFPIYLTLIFALLTLAVTLRFEEKTVSSLKNTRQNFRTHSREILATILSAVAWIRKTPFALAIIAGGMLYDHLLRLTVTLTSQYFRLIHLPEVSFGFISSAISVLGLFVPKVSEQMADRYSPKQNMYTVGIISFAGLASLAAFLPYVGILSVGLIFIAMMMTAFFTSHYLNRITASAQRATVLSFKGLAFNLAYGLIGFIFALASNHFKQAAQTTHPDWTAKQVADATFISTVHWFPGYFVVLTTLAIILLAWILKNNTECTECG